MNLSVTYRKAQSVCMSKITCKEKPSNLQNAIKAFEFHADGGLKG